VFFVLVRPQRPRSPLLASPFLTRVSCAPLTQHARWLELILDSAPVDVVVNVGAHPHVRETPMSDDKSHAAEAPAEGKEPPKKKRGKLVPVVAALMIAEGAGVYFVVSTLNKKPASAQATELKHGEEHKDEAFVEIPLVEDHFQNMQTGRVWVWDAAIVVRTRKKHEQTVTNKLQERAAEINEGIATIFRRATNAQLKEPGLETVNRQVQAYLDQLVGKDTTGEEPVNYIDRVLIPRCRGFPAE